MKKISLTILTLCLSVLMLSCGSKKVQEEEIESEQFDIWSFLEPKVTVEDGVFDSTKNFLGIMNVETYKGQTLLVLPCEFPEYGYENFKKFVDAKKLDKRFTFDWARYGKSADETKYNTASDDLNGKYFIVDSVECLENGDYMFFLTNKEDNSDKCYFIYDPEYDFKFPFLVVSHYNYLANNYVGKYYVCNTENNPWKCTRIATEYHGICLELVCKNDTAIRNEEQFRFDKYGQFVFEKTEWDKYVKSVGEKYMKSVLRSEIEIGMPEALVYLSLGLPKSKSEDSYGEKQLVFEKSDMRTYVYIKDGKVSSWQKNQ